MFDSFKYFGDADWWMKGLKSRYIDNIDEQTSDDLANTTRPPNRGVRAELDQSNVITSQSKTPGWNYLLLDIDSSDVYIKESSTEGHYHIAFPHAIMDSEFETLVSLLHRVGIISPGNFTSYKRCGWFALRTPWVKKGKTKALTDAGIIGKQDFKDNEEALLAIEKACRFLEVEYPTEIDIAVSKKSIKRVDIDLLDDLQF